MFPFGDERLAVLHETTSRCQIEQIASQIERQDIAEFASPKDWNDPMRVTLQNLLGEVRVLAFEQEIGEQIGIRDDQGRPSCLA